MVERRARVHLRRPARAAPGRARHHDLVRVERGRRRPRRQRAVAGCPARRPAERGGHLSPTPTRSSAARSTGSPPASRRRARRPRRLVALGDERRAAARRGTGSPPGSSCPGCTATSPPRSGSREIELTRSTSSRGTGCRGAGRRSAPVKTQSRIDRPGGKIAAGRTAVAGVAWAPTRGISTVEVRIDEEPWRIATLGPSVGDDSWRAVVDRAGTRPRAIMSLMCRATDGTGETQTERGPVPTLTAPPAGTPSR